MCAVAGHVVSNWIVLDTSSAPSERSTRIRSGTWQDALTIVSKDVRATDTRKPRDWSSRARRTRESVSASATSTCGSERSAAVGRGNFSVAVCNPDI
jgi:hypothetical protein